MDKTYPCQPCSTVRAKCQIPGRLESLEIFIWLEEGAHAEGVEESKGKQDGEDVAGLGSYDIRVKQLRGSTA